MTHAEANTPKLFTGEWVHLFGSGRKETRCQILLDQTTKQILAGQAWTGLKFEDLSKAELLDLQESVIEVNEAHVKPGGWGLDACRTWPEWASPSLSDEQIEKIRQLDFVIECATGESDAGFDAAVTSKTEYLDSQGLTRESIAHSYERPRQRG